MIKLLLQELRNRRSAILGWGIGIGIFAGYVVVLFEEFAGQMANFNFEDIGLYQLFGDFGDMATFKGFVSTEVFIFFPLLLAIYAIVNGTGTLAGEEDNGTLEPLLALPLKRWQIVLTKMIALTIAFLLIMAIVSLSLVLGYSALPDTVDTGGVTAGDLVLASYGSLPLVLFFATLSLFMGAYLPSRRTAATVATIILIISYLGNNLAELVEVLQNIDFLFAFNYYNGGRILETGVDAGDTLILLAASAVFLALAIASFERRNVMVGAWPWRRAQVPAGTD